MRLVIDGRMILAHMTGVGRYLLGLIPALLSESDDLDITLWVQDCLSLHHPVWDLAQGRVKIQRLPFGQLSGRGFFQLPLELRKEAPDLFHSPHFDLPWGASVPRVATIHDMKYIVHPEFFPSQGKLKQLLVHWMVAGTCRRSRLILVDSRSTARDLNLTLGVPERKIRVAPLGVAPEFSQQRPATEVASVRHKYQLEGPYLIFVGERRPHKNIPGLLQAFQIFRAATERPFQLAIVGRPYANYRTPETLAAEYGLEHAVVFIDHPPDEDLPALYQAAEALVTLSYYEGFGLTLLEAMAAGTPVVAADRTSLPEVAGEAALLVPPDDPQSAAAALQQVVTGGASRRRCISAGIQRAREFTWDACARATVHVYREALA